jgi:hypothetical protein
MYLPAFRDDSGPHYQFEIQPLHHFIRQVSSHMPVVLTESIVTPVGNRARVQAYAGGLGFSQSTTSFFIA